MTERWKRRGEEMMKMEMRRSRVLARLRAGETVRVMKLNLADSRAAEMAARAGFDCLWTDREHVPNDLAVVERQVLAAKAYDVDLLCRVPRGSYSDLIWPLEMDSAGIMVPHVKTRKEAEDIVQMTRFHPVGRRPIDGGNADAAFCGMPIAEYAEQANRERFVMLQIEDPEALDELEEIAAVPGYDMLFFGPGDFSHGLGILGRMDDPRIADARKRVAEACRRHGKYAGTTGTPAAMAELADLGYSFISLGADVIGLVSYFRDIARAAGIETANAPVSIYGTPGKE
jgi:4-hydroxy-2-oxoheptanedioate aldolase